MDDHLLSGSRALLGVEELAAVLTVILLAADCDPDELPDGDRWGSNAWRANDS